MAVNMVQAVFTTEPRPASIFGSGGTKNGSCTTKQGVWTGQIMAWKYREICLSKLYRRISSFNDIHIENTTFCRVWGQAAIAREAPLSFKSGHNVRKMREETVSTFPRQKTEAKQLTQCHFISQKAPNVDCLCVK